DKGRIWRIVPASTPSTRNSQRAHLAGASTEELVTLLSHRNAWWRVTAQRLLLERGDPNTHPPLRAAARDPPHPLARLHAAWLLAAFGALDDDLIIALSRADVAGLRENAARLAEVAPAVSPALRDRLEAMADDPDARVRFQTALCLGRWNDDRIVGPLLRIALAGAGRRWARLAVASAVRERAGSLIAAMPVAGVKPAAGVLAVMRELSAVVGARHDGKEVASTLEAVLALEGAEAARWQLAAFDGLVEGLTRR